MNLSKRTRMLCATPVLISLLGTLGFAQGAHWFDAGMPDDIVAPIARLDEISIGAFPPLAKLHVGTSGSPLPAALFEGDVTVDGGRLTITNSPSIVDLAIVNPAGSVLHMRRDSSNEWFIDVSGTDNQLEFIAGNPAGFPQMVIQHSTAGNVGMGTKSPTEKLHVVGNICVTGSYFTCSSRRWKENITPIPDALEKVQQLRGVSFDWKETGKHDIGMIAEDVSDVLPEIVQYEENGKDAKGVDYARLTAVLVEAVKELKAENENLKAQNEELAAKQIAMTAKQIANEERLAALEQAIAASAND